MFNSSVITKTGQMWKFSVGVIAVLVGSIAPLFEASGISLTVGTVIAVVGYAYSVAFTQCPACKQRWLWKALLDAGLYGPLFKKPTCPACQHDFS